MTANKIQSLLDMLSTDSDFSFFYDYIEISKYREEVNNCPFYVVSVFDEEPLDDGTPDFLNHPDNDEISALYTMLDKCGRRYYEPHTDAAWELDGFSVSLMYTSHDYAHDYV